jgi:hypothetical protein
MRRLSACFEFGYRVRFCTKKEGAIDSIDRPLFFSATINVPIASASSNLTISIGGINLSTGQHILNINIVRAEINGVEFFVLTSGEAGMSVSGLALLCGVGQNAIQNIIQAVITSSCSEFLKGLCGKQLTLITSSVYKNVTVLRDDVCAIFLEWYAFESQRTTKKARDTYRKFAQAGIRVWIQKQTNWEKAKVAGKKQIEVSSTATETLTSAEALVKMANAMLAQERRLTGAEGTIEVVKDKVEIVEEKMETVEDNLSELTLRVGIMSKSLPWTGREMRVAIANCLDNPGQATLSNIRIGQICYCSEAMVRKVKGEILEKSQKEQPQQQTSKKSSKKSTRIQLNINLEMGGE